MVSHGNVLMGVYRVVIKVVIGSVTHVTYFTTFIRRIDLTAKPWSSLGASLLVAAAKPWSYYNPKSSLGASLLVAAAKPWSFRHTSYLQPITTVI